MTSPLLLRMLTALTLTELVEDLAARLLNTNKQDRLRLLLINGITNPVLNYLLILLQYAGAKGWLLAGCSLAGECLVVLTEAALLKSFCGKLPLKAGLFAFIVNACSCLGGLFLVLVGKILAPGLF